METMLKSEFDLSSITPNMGTMLLGNRCEFRAKPAFAEKDDSGQYQEKTWDQLAGDCIKIATFFDDEKLTRNARVAFVSGNSYYRLVGELAAMATGRVSVPIFPGYSSEFLGKILDFSDVEMLFVENEALLENIPAAALPSKIVLLSKANTEKNAKMDFVEDLVCQKSLTEDEIATVEKTMLAVKPSQLALIMYTSGTTSFPKGVMLTQNNILSQQAALVRLWKPEPGMRFLCYLPWHHSFGGLFERFFALHSGGCLAIDDSSGRDVDLLLRNFSAIKPHVYFSVPKVYIDIIGQTLSSKEIERNFFHSELKFVFTAAAPLPLNISDIFRQHKIPVLEGWGLTETSPCCTLTGVSLDREVGVVGKPIPGVEIKLADDGELLVRGRNVMQGYYKNNEATMAVLATDGWFKTGDIGSIDERGVKILSRKDRVFKLSNGEKVFPTPIEEALRARCRFVKHAYVFGAGQKAPLALLFPNDEMINNSKKLSESMDCEDCCLPHSFGKLGDCLGECIRAINADLREKFSRLGSVLLVNHELCLDKNELTPSFKLIPRNVEKNYDAHIKYLRARGEGDLPDGAVLMNLSVDKSK